VEQLTSPVELNLLSWNSLSPRAIFSAVWGLSCGIGVGGKPKGGEVPGACIAWIPAAQMNRTAKSVPKRYFFMTFPPCCFRYGDGRFRAEAAISIRVRRTETELTYKHRNLLHTILFLSGMILEKTQKTFHLLKQLIKYRRVQNDFEKDGIESFALSDPRGDSNEWPDSLSGMIPYFS
jgi:hypothetical protein